MTNNLTFNQWLDLFIEEKQISLDDHFEIEGPSGPNHMTYQNVIDAMRSTTDNERREIRKMLVKIDFINGDVKKYLRHLAQALAL